MLGVANGENAVPLPIEPNPAPTGDVGLIPKLVEILLWFAVEEDGVIPCPFPFPKEKDMPLALLDDGGDTRLGTPIPPLILTPTPTPPGLLITASEELIGMNGGVGGERCCCWKYPFTVAMDGETNGLEDGVDGKGNPFPFP
jgi:hypothetical protein